MDQTDCQRHRAYFKEAMCRLQEVSFPAYAARYVELEKRLVDSKISMLLGGVDDVRVIPSGS
jgi:hypothetical protein